MYVIYDMFRIMKNIKYISWFFFYVPNENDDEFTQTEIRLVAFFWNTGKV